jgi:TPR repeat protein
VDCFTRSIELDRTHTNAAFWLGVAHFRGSGVAQDYERAVYYFRRAAEQGDRTAQFNLGLCYHEGYGVPQDFVEAVRWYGKAADRGYAHAPNSLGRAYARAEGVPQDYAEAAFWYRKGAEAGDAYAQDNLGACYAPWIMGRKLPAAFKGSLRHGTPCLISLLRRGIRSQRITS